MGRIPSRLPARLADGPFRVRAAVDAGLGVGRLKGPDLDATVWGVRSPAPLDSPGARLLAVVSGLPEDVALSHLTAARLWGMPGLPLPADDDPVHVMRASSRPRIERIGCVHHRGLETRALERLDNLAVVGALDTWADLAQSLGVTDLVVIADALCSGRVTRPRVPVAALERTVSARRGARGVGRLAAALPLVRAGSASAMETRARLTFHAWGLPEPELNINIYDRYGQWLAKPDFVWRTRRVLAEYDGDQHRTDRSRWQYERTRRLALEAEGWTYVELTAESLADPEARTLLWRRLTVLLAR